jgi:hypothetical protein
VSKVIIEIRPAKGAHLRVEVIVRDEQGGILFSDRCDLASVEGRLKSARTLCAKLRDKGIERTPEQVEAVLETKWNELLQQRDQAEAPGGAGDQAGAADDVEELGLRLLEALDKDVVAEAKAVLRGPGLLARIVADIEAVGVAGEKELGAILYLVGVSRKLPRPLAALVRGPSASGKSYVIDRVASLAPPEAVIHATQMTRQALFHMKENALQHRLIVAGERSRRQDDDAAEATRALREMISAGHLSKLMPMRISDVIQTVLIEQEGPIAFVESTSAEQLFEEDENRLVQLFTDERREQTRQVLERLAAEAAASASGRGAARVVQLHYAMQRLLRPREVLVPFAERLARLIPDTRIEARRAFPHLLGAIQANALLHQFQRELDAQGRVLAAQDDYQVAARLLKVSMRRVLGGGVGEPAQRFFLRLREWFKGDEFTARQAQAKEETSRSGVYSWLQELRKAGAVERTEPTRGRSPAQWHALDVNPDELAGNILPAVEEVFPHDG